MMKIMLRWHERPCSWLICIYPGLFQVSIQLLALAYPMLVCIPISESGKTEAMSINLTPAHTWGGNSIFELHATVFMIAFCTAYFSTFLNKTSANGKFLWNLVVELWHCSQGHVMTQLMQMFPVVNISTRFFTSMINLAIHDDSNVIWPWINCNW